jgi:RNA polymerase sigma-70 factor, ECF subfamily
MKNTKNSIPGGTDVSSDCQNIRPSCDDVVISEDDLLIARCRGGNMVAFGQLVEKYQDRLFNAVLRMVANQDDALELTQEAFFRAIKGLKNFKGRAGFYTWLFRIGMNLALNHRKRSQTVRFASIHSSDEMLGTQADGLLAAVSGRQDNSPVRQAQVNEDYHRLLQALENLEPNARAVVVLRDIEELDYDQIAKILEVPTGTVKSRLARARALLRQQLMES